MPKAHKNKLFSKRSFYLGCVCLFRLSLVLCLDGEFVFVNSFKIKLFGGPEFSVVDVEVEVVLILSTSDGVRDLSVHSNVSIGGLDL